MGSNCLSVGWTLTGEGMHYLPYLIIAEFPPQTSDAPYLPCSGVGFPSPLVRVMQITAPPTGPGTGAWFAPSPSMGRACPALPCPEFIEGSSKDVEGAGAGACPHMPAQSPPSLPPFPQPLGIPEARHPKTLRRKPGGTLRVLPLPLGMLTTVHFDDQAGLETHEVHDIAPMSVWRRNLWPPRRAARDCCHKARSASVAFWRNLRAAWRRVMPFPLLPPGERGKTTPLHGS